MEECVVGELKECERNRRNVRRTGRLLQEPVENDRNGWNVRGSSEEQEECKRYRGNVRGTRIM